MPTLFSLVIGLIAGVLLAHRVRHKQSILPVALACAAGAFGLMLLLRQTPFWKIQLTSQDVIMFGLAFGLALLGTRPRRPNSRFE